MTNSSNDRYVQRLDNEERHPVHGDTGDPDVLATELEEKDYGPIPLPMPTLIVRTDNGFVRRLTTSLAFAGHELRELVGHVTCRPTG